MSQTNNELRPKESITKRKKLNNVNLKNKMLQKEMQMLKVKISENPEFTPKEQIVCSKSLCARSHTQEKLNFLELDKMDTLSDTLAVAVSVCLYLLFSGVL